MIENIKDLKKIQIVCRNQNQVKDCLKYLKQLGFNVDYYNCENYLVVLYDTSFDGFLTSYELEKKYIEFYNKKLVKTLQKFIKEKERQEKIKKEKIKDIEVASDGRIEARDKAIFKLEIETKLKNIAERLNAGRKIDWEYEKQPKFNINYDFIDYKKMYCNVACHYKSQGTIYCLDENFLEVAKKEIGEDNLIKYFKED